MHVTMYHIVSNTCHSHGFTTLYVVACVTQAVYHGCKFCKNISKMKNARSSALHSRCPKAKVQEGRGMLSHFPFHDIIIMVANICHMPTGFETCIFYRCEFQPILDMPSTTNCVFRNLLNREPHAKEKPYCFVKIDQYKAITFGPYISHDAFNAHSTLRYGVPKFLPSTIRPTWLSFGTRVEAVIVGRLQSDCWFVVVFHCFVAMWWSCGCGVL